MISFIHAVSVTLKVLFPVFTTQQTEYYYSHVIFFQYLFIWLRWVLVVACKLLTVQHVGSSFLTKDRNPAPCTGSEESQSLDHQGSPSVSSVQSLSRVRLCDPMNCSMAGLPVHHQLPEFTQTHVHRVNDAIHHLILCRPLLLLPSIFPSIRVFSNESALCIRWPKYWSFSFNISPSNEHPRLISFRMDGLDLLAVQGTLKSLLQHHSSKASILQNSAFFRVQISHLYVTNGKTIAVTRWTFFDNVSAFEYVVQAGHNFPSKE